jgi:anti-sigma regulatory factor (Ser/Thr protein kinase)
MLAYRGLVTEESKVGEARRAALAACAQLGFGDELAGKTALVVTELGTNLVKHAGPAGGQFLLQCGTLGGVSFFDILALDKGAGIENVGQAFGDGFSTSGTYGAGLGGIRNMAGQFDLHSEPGKGVAVFARMFETPPPAGWDIGAVEVPINGETVCGDGWDAAYDDTGLTLLVSDGLGHGPNAHEASEQAKRHFRQTAPGQGPLEVLQRIHANLRATRGAAVAVTRWQGNDITFGGIGNISGVVLGGPRNQQMVSMSGITGHEARRVQTFSYEGAAGRLMILHSDGLQTRWDLSAYRGLAGKHPGLIAGVLFRDFNRGRDDTTVVAVRRK